MGRSTRRAGRLFTLALATALTAGVQASAAWAVVGNPTVASTTAGQTGVTVTQGKARGSGLWGYAGDVETHSSSSGTVFTYGIAVSPLDGSLWVTDSAKVQYTTNQLLCTFAGGGTLVGSECYIGKSRLNHYSLTGTDWSVGQYNGNGTYSAAAAGANDGVGANYQSLSAATVLDGSTLTNGRFGGARGVAVTTDGHAWVADSDWGLNSVSNSRKVIRTFNPDVSEAGVSVAGCVGTAAYCWSIRNQGDILDYAVGSARMNNGDILITSQTQDQLKEFKPDGTFVRNIFLDQSAGTAYTGDTGYRPPYAVGIDPATGDALVGYIDPGNGMQSFIERVDLTNCTTQSAGYPAGSFQDHCAVKNRIGVGTLGTGNGGSSSSSNAITFAIQVDPVTEDIYVAQTANQAYVFASDGTYKGRFSAFGLGSANGQVTTPIRGITFDSRGFLYATMGQGTANTRVQIFARTPDPVTNLAAVLSTDKTSAALTWTALATGVTADGQAPLRDYVVEASTDGGTTWTVMPTPTSTVANQTITGLDPSKTYSFRVTAWNEAGNGDPAVAVAMPAAPLSPLTVTKTVSASLTRTYGWKIDKSISTPGSVDASGNGSVGYKVETTEAAATDSGWAVTGKITVANPNTVDVTTTVTDAMTLGGGADCPVQNGAGQTIPANGSVVLDYQCSFTGEPSLSGTNTATAAWTDNTGDHTAKTDVPIAASDWKITKVDDSVNVTDTATVPGSADKVKTFGPYSWSAAGTKHTESYDLAVTVPSGSCLTVNNTAEIDETAASASAPAATLCHKVAMTGADPATASLTRTYGWDIDKELTNKGDFDDPVAAGSANLDYKVTVTDGAAENSKVTATGHVTLTNPNDFADYTVDLADSVDIPGVTCVLEKTTGITVPKSGSTTVDYTCTGDPGTTYSGTNTVTVSPTDGTSFTAFDISGALVYTVTPVNASVSVSDTRQVFSPQWLIDWNKAGTEHSKTYTVTVPVVAGECAKYENTASIDQTSQSDTATFTVCGKAVPPCVADQNAISVVYSTQNDADAAQDGSYVVYDRVKQGRSDMKLVYTIVKGCVTFPYPKLTYTGPWTLGSDPDTFANFTFAFGATTQAIADKYAVQIAAMNAGIAQCTSTSVADFAACVDPVIDTWGGSIPIGITGTVTVSVRASTPGQGSLTFHVEQRDSGTVLSPTVTTPYVVTQPTVTLTGAGQLCVGTSAFDADGRHYQPTGKDAVAYALNAVAAEPGATGARGQFNAERDDDATAITVNDSGLSYRVAGATFTSTSAVQSFLRTQAAGTYTVVAEYTAPDGTAAIPSGSVTITVLAAKDLACYTSTAIIKPTPTPSPTVTPTTSPVHVVTGVPGVGGLNPLAIAAGILVACVGLAIALSGHRRPRRRT